MAVVRVAYRLHAARLVRLLNLMPEPVTVAMPATKLTPLRGGCNRPPTRPQFARTARAKSLSPSASRSETAQNAIPS
jgi:hypothetical protein